MDTRTVVRDAAIDANLRRQSEMMQPKMWIHRQQQEMQSKMLTHNAHNAHGRSEMQVLG